MGVGVSVGVGAVLAGYGLCVHFRRAGLALEEYSRNNFFIVL